MTGQFAWTESPGLLNLGDAGAEGLSALRKCLEKARNEIPQDQVRAAVEAYRKRLKPVIRAKGGHIE
ncbi:hypothetical protein ANCDUO_23922 [Ancylostoma duodenale]|uniref:Uncharacterized protein n=1 Tax=Ancylostoma duodenale TaxID=51022 RepID=A0A0C2C8K1_9BILA|nr:hypothetical protein ANCDUO_23922 [Ancylostoma duodenale]